MGAKLKGMDKASVDGGKKRNKSKGGGCYMRNALFGRFGCGDEASGREGVIHTISYPGCVGVRVLAKKGQKAESQIDIGLGNNFDVLA